MSVIDKSPALIKPGLKGLEAFGEAIGEPLHPHEKRVARAYFGPAREVCAILPRGNAKTTLAAKIAVHHLLSVPGAAAPAPPPPPAPPPAARGGGGGGEP